MYLRMLRQRLQVYGGDLAGDLDLQRCEAFTIALQHHLAATCQLRGLQKQAKLMSRSRWS